ncbi:alpha/beta hydrolase family protein [Luteolibacter luteus]|uniref:Acetyl xylan esterase domain-containing protein n=1 Tax=Luteolibacter luteus TaxID=2728835 RepID=A0A858RJ63_9BACT|nr:acetylxylan esterase [Luteolibacter luteus]QJE96621.1 hypothetical protein HHL09_12775 [Luteolibacter luteus]
MMHFRALLALSLITALHGDPVTLNTPREFPSIDSREEWQSRAKDIREQILVSCGLWPLPDKVALGAKIFGKIERDGYSVEKVYFKTYPGFYLAGNLYRPLGKGSGPFPAILNPHGHWDNGRLADEEAGSIPARCISFARQGMIAFSYDMVGYNDTRFAGDPDVHRKYGTSRTDELWGINAMGLQLWNSIRALDFLESLPDVDRKKLACTGESGGGTQTFVLGAVDDRLAAQVPVVMVSHSMQGGCNCENAPGLRVDYSNMEIAAAAAPRPQLIVGATGDWTKTTMEKEGPAIASIYKLLNAEDRFKYVRFDFGHNYNKTSREAVYDWLGHRLLENPDLSSLKEQPYQKEADVDLRVFPDGKLPDDALTMEEFIAARKAERSATWQKLLPQDKESLVRFKEFMAPAWQHIVQTDWRPGTGFASTISASVKPGNEKPKEALVVELGGEAGSPAKNHEALTFLRLPWTEEPDRDETSGFYTSYNRTALQQASDRLISAVINARRTRLAGRVILLGSGSTAISSLMAAPVADAVAIDCNGLDPSADETLLKPGLFAPGLRNIGTYQGAAMFAAPNRLLLYNTQGKFPTADIEAAYRAAGASDKLEIIPGPKTREEILAWAARP